MIVAGYILAVIGCIAALVGELLMLTVAYKRGLGWFLGCLFLAPLFWVPLLAVQFKATAKPFAIALIGLIFVAVGGSMAGIEV